MPNVVWVDLDKLNLEEGASAQKFNLATHSDASGQVADMLTRRNPRRFSKLEQRRINAAVQKA